MKTRTEVLMEQINENQKLVFGLQDKITELEKKIKIAKANLREEK